MKLYHVTSFLVIFTILGYSQAVEEDTTFLNEKIKRIYEIITGMEKGILQKKRDLNILLNKYPLKGTCDREAYDSLHVVIKHITAKYGKAFSSSNEALEEIFRDEPSRYDLLLVLLEVSHEAVNEAGTPYAAASAQKRNESKPRYLNSEAIRIVAVEVARRKIVWDYTLLKSEGWFTKGNRRKTNEFTEIARLADRIGFNSYGKKAVYKLNDKLTEFYETITE